MANIFKSLDKIGLVVFAKRITLSIRKFFATKIEMDVVATALTDLNSRIGEAMPNISVGTVTTVDSSKDAQVTISKTETDLKLNFSIPRGQQGDMAEKDDAGYSNLEGQTLVDYCEAGLIWQIPTDENYQFVPKLQVPIPSYKSITSMADCIRMTKDVTLLISGIQYTWSQLHWYLQCSSVSENAIVYVAKYGTNHTNSPFSIYNSTSVQPTPTTIEVVVRCEPGSNGGSYDIQITVENRYGRAYYLYLGSKLDSIVIK